MGTENFLGTVRERFRGGKKTKNGNEQNYLFRDSSQFPVRRVRNRAGKAKMLVSTHIGVMVVGEVGVGGGLSAFRGNRDMFTRRRMGVI